MTKKSDASTAEDPATSTTVKSTTSTEEAPTTNSSTTQETSSPSAQTAIEDAQKILTLSIKCKDIFSRITDVQRKMVNLDKMVPADMAELRSEVSGYYGYLMGELGELEIRKSEAWGELKERNKSDTSAEREWHTTEAGKLEVRINARKKPLENMSSALRSALEVKVNEASGRM